MLLMMDIFVLVDPRNLPLKFGPNWVSDRWNIVVVVVFNIVVAAVRFVVVVVHIVVVIVVVVHLVVVVIAVVDPGHCNW